MRILGISDTHSLHKQWEELNEHLLNGYFGIDMIIHSGDISHIGEHKQVESFLKWYHDIPVKHKIFILGNHEKGVEYDIEWIRDQIAVKFNTITFLHHEHVTIEGIKIFGSPYTPYFHGWAFNVQRDDLKYYWDEIESDTDVIVTHGPPLGVGDATRYGELTGCFHLLLKVLEIKPQVHQYGHIHEARGKRNIQDNHPNTLFVNAACIQGFPYSIIQGLNIYEIQAKEKYEDDF